MFYRFSLKQNRVFHQLIAVGARSALLKLSKQLIEVHALQVRTTDQSWSDVRRQLKKDGRWDLASLLSREEKERSVNLCR